MNALLRDVLILYIMMMGLCQAYEWTAIFTPQGNAVQCNKWGWRYDQTKTIWKTACTPLEVMTDDGITKYFIVTTKDKCEDDEVAMFSYNKGDTQISFDGCYHSSELQI